MALLLHGFTHTGASWGPVARALGERCSVLAPDVRGHGAASGVSPVDLEGVIADLAALAPRRFVLGGYSMGGRLALHAALALPERVSRLVLVGASPGIARDAERAARREDDERLAAQFERLTIAEVVELWEARTTTPWPAVGMSSPGPGMPAPAPRTTSPLLAGQPASVARAVREDRLRNTPPGLAAALRGLGTGALPSLWERLGELSMPVTLVVGERDRRFHEIAADMAGRIADARVVVVPGAGHAVHLEAPQAVADVLAAEA